MFRLWGVELIPSREEMKFLDQTKFGPKEGDCFAACIASLLGLDIDEVPDFGQGKKNWYRLFEEWLRCRRLAPLTVYGKSAIIPKGVYYLAGGKSSRGIPHSVIYLNGEMVHDPHPDRDGLAEVTDYLFLVPLNTSTPLKAKHEEKEP